MKTKGLFARPGALFAVIVAIVTALCVAYQTKAAPPYPDTATVHPLHKAR